MIYSQSQTVNQLVVGSIPTAGANFLKALLEKAGPFAFFGYSFEFAKYRFS